MELPGGDGFSLALPGRIVFGRGTASSAGAEAARLGRRVLLVRSASAAYADVLMKDLEARGLHVTTCLARGEPRLDAVETLLDVHRRAPVDVVIAIGGGSTIDLGKALAALLPSDHPAMAHLEIVGEGRPLEVAPLPFIAVPTTAGTGAEATRNSVIGVPDHRRKVSLRDARMLPDLAIVDPALTDGCPRDVTLASGLDAVAQVIEPYLSSRANPFTDSLCEKAIPMGLAALRQLMDGEVPAARDAMSYVSLASGIALSNAGLGAVHGLAGVLGGMTDVPHGVLCGRFLVPVLRENLRAMTAQGIVTTRIERVIRDIALVLEAEEETALDAFETWITREGLPRAATLTRSLDLAEVARAAMQSSSMKGNPVPLTQDALVRILSA
jgi:alcohol dehydrogenase class IV